VTDNRNRVTPYDDLLRDLTRQQEDRFTALVQTGMPEETAHRQAQREFLYARIKLVDAAVAWLSVQPITPVVLFCGTRTPL
jgi:hypothetical protein